MRGMEVINSFKNQNKFSALLRPEMPNDILSFVKNPERDEPRE
jgi:hypothetical protein